MILVRRVDMISLCKLWSFMTNSHDIIEEFFVFGATLTSDEHDKKSIHAYVKYGTS